MLSRNFASFLSSWLCLYTPQPRIVILLRRCVFDNDDEVRDRATLFLNALGGDGGESVATVAGGPESFMLETLAVPLGNLDASLNSYVSGSLGGTGWKYSTAFSAEGAWGPSACHLVQPHEPEGSSCPGCSCFLRWWSPRLWQPPVSL